MTLTVPRNCSPRAVFGITIAHAAACVELGGELLRPPGGPSDYGRTCYIRDPAGVVAALFQPGPRYVAGT